MFLDSGMFSPCSGDAMPKEDRKLQPVASSRVGMPTNLNTNFH